MKIKVILFCFISLLMLSCGRKEENHEKAITSLGDLEGLKASVILGSVQDIYLTDKCPNCKLLRLGNPSELMAALENNIVDYMAIDSSLLMGNEAKDKEMVPCFNLRIPFDVAVAFNKTSQELCMEFNSFLEIIKKDGTYNDMVKRWTLDSINENQIPIIELPSDGEPLTFGVMAMFPFEFIMNGEWTGFEIEMLKRFCKFVNRPIKFETYDLAGLMAAVTTHKVDGVCSFLCVTPERAKQVLFSDPYYVSQSYLVYCENVTDSPDSSFFQRVKDSFVNNLITENRWKLIVQGLWETIIISVFSIFFGILVGMIICAIRMSGKIVLSSIATCFVDMIRGMPILVFLMIMFYIIFSNSPVSARIVSVIAFSFYFGAYTSEMFRSGILTVDKGQWEAGMALGFTKAGTFKNFVLPIAIKNISPVFKGEAVSLIKNTSVVGYIGVQDLTKVSDMIRARTFDAFFPLIIISIIYFILAWLLGRVIEKVTEKL